MLIVHSLLSFFMQRYFLWSKISFLLAIVEVTLEMFLLHIPLLHTYHRPWTPRIQQAIEDTEKTFFAQVFGNIGRKTLQEAAPGSAE